MCTAVKEMNIEVILIVMNTTQGWVVQSWVKITQD